MTGEEVKQFRESLQMGLDDFADLIGLKKRQLQRIENEGWIPQTQTVIIITMLKELQGTRLGRKFGV